jgi:hypothetical protein
MLHRPLPPNLKVILTALSPQSPLRTLACHTPRHLQSDRPTHFQLVLSQEAVRLPNCLYRSFRTINTK